MLTDAKLPTAVASNGLAAFNLGGVAGAISGGFVISRIGSRPTMLAITALAVAGTLMLAATPIGPVDEHAAHRRAARPVRRRHQRDPDHAVRSGRAHVPDDRARHRRRNRGCRRPHRRRPQLVRRVVGARPGRQREFLPADVRRDGVRLRLPRAGAAPRASTCRVRVFSAEGLRPSDSPTGSLAGPLAPLRSPGSLPSLARAFCLCLLPFPS